MVWGSCFIFLIAYIVNTEAAPPVFNCSFEEAGRVHGYDYTGDDEFCGARQDTTDEFNWMLNEGRTESPGTGPDRAGHGLWYIFTDASGRRNGDQARLLLPKFQERGRFYISFKYSMRGTITGLGKLRLYHVHGSTWSQIFARTGPQDPRPWIWYTGDTWCDASRGDYVVIEATMKGNYQGDIAVDHIMEWKS